MSLVAKTTLAASTLLIFAQQTPLAAAFLAPPSAITRHCRVASTPAAIRRAAPPPLFVKEDAMQGGDDPMLDEMFGGFTAKQRLREEIESPFRTVRLTLLGASTGSALVALYFSLIASGKALAGFQDVAPLSDSLGSCAVNVGAAAVCGFLTWRDWQAGEANLRRIAKGGAFADLRVTPADGSASVVRLGEFRRDARVLICAGGDAYLTQLAVELGDDRGTPGGRTGAIPRGELAAAIAAVDVVVVPVLLRPDGGLGDARTLWRETSPAGDGADAVVAFPPVAASAAWDDYLESELATLKKQGFDPLTKGFTITVKKNGRILRRASGLPPWDALIGTMEVMDGSKFGMPGDSEKYGNAAREFASLRDGASDS